MRSTVIIRADGGKRIGMGHIMRCSAVARELRTLSCQVVFAVSDEESAQAVAIAGESAIVVGGQPEALSERDGVALRNLAEELSAKAVLVDSYGVSNAFFTQIKGTTRIVYVDDTYLFSEGFLKRPYRYDIDAVVNYGFGFSGSIYESVYFGSQTDLCIGPAFAPVRNEFLLACADNANAVKRVLVTSGSTNPNGALERMVEGVLGSAPETAIDVVVGPLSKFNVNLLQGGKIYVHENVKHMSSLMASVDLAVSAAGSTLYELCCVGVPTVALPIVENQLANAIGFSQLGLGASVVRTDWSKDDVRDIVASLISSKQLRLRFSTNSRASVDGRGAQRIAQVINAVS
ncbi:UDP-2,4-diacetamido-2,4,6-trideoxy-beta-L-altropyranose hydrolase [Adlercreutzia caecimuris]|uniref:UDP-2,4-diacetamido-2,4, 6-trideoxy-beta-L-altropyranose hydrolase n=1 Tax=Adlercreutzia caecimuris TaxID=671266 RepID=UPI001C3EF216|nr:UDP-2,4-diacetamido-2,4,6-trideoxy-beta-L-altropyranose hydrolase [Adlercreutzia caecimuris]